jgi:hypothetical protein
LVPNGGLGTLVLVQPLDTHSIREINIPSEKVYIVDQPFMPKIEDGAYLNMIMNCAATVAAGSVISRLDFVWS